VSDLEAQSPPDGTFLRTIIVNPVGPTETDNGQELLDALGTALTLSPTQANPVLVKVEPGTYELLHDQRIDVFDYITLVGAGPNATRIVKRNTGPIDGYLISIQTGGEIRDFTLERDTFDPAPFIAQTAVLVGTAQTNVLIDNVRIIGPVIPNYSGIRLFSSAEVTLRDVEIVNFLDAIEMNINGIALLQNVTATGLIFLRSGDNVAIRNSVVEDLQASFGSIDVANSQVIGSVLGGANVRCVFAYDDLYLPLGPTCL